MVKSYLGEFGFCVTAAHTGGAGEPLGSENQSNTTTALAGLLHGRGSRGRPRRLRGCWHHHWHARPRPLEVLERGTKLSEPRLVHERTYGEVALAVKELDLLRGHHGSQRALRRAQHLDAAGGTCLTGRSNRGRIGATDEDRSARDVNASASCLARRPRTRLARSRSDVRTLQRSRCCRALAKASASHQVLPLRLKKV